MRTRLRSLLPGLWTRRRSVIRYGIIALLFIGGGLGFIRSGFGTSGSAVPGFYYPSQSQIEVVVPDATALDSLSVTIVVGPVPRSDGLRAAFLHLRAESYGEEIPYFIYGASDTARAFLATLATCKGWRVDSSPESQASIEAAVGRPLTSVDHAPPAIYRFSTTLAGDHSQSQGSGDCTGETAPAYFAQNGKDVIISAPMIYVETHLDEDSRKKLARNWPALNLSGPRLCVSSPRWDHNEPSWRLEYEDYHDAEERNLGPDWSEKRASGYSRCNRNWLLWPGQRAHYTDMAAERSQSNWTFWSGILLGIGGGMLGAELSFTGPPTLEAMRRHLSPRWRRAKGAGPTRPERTRTGPARRRLRLRTPRRLRR